MKRRPCAFIILAGLLLALAAPTCYFVAERNNPDDPENLDEFMGFPVVDTGQVLCYDAAGTTITCVPYVDSYPNQDGYFEDTPRARDFFGPTADVTYTSDYTTRDLVAGLVWRSCTQGWSGSDCSTDDADANTYLWDDAVTACAALNDKNSGTGYAGRRRWRLPTIMELSTLPNYGIPSAPAIDQSHFPNTWSDNYWSSTHVAGELGGAWYVDFTSGYVSAYGTAANDDYVRCVADGP